MRYIGLSNYTTGQMEEALRVAGEKSLPRFVSLQPHYNMVWREEYESKKMALCEANGIAVIPYSPLEGGFLTGKYKRGEKPPHSQRAGNAKHFMTDEGFTVIDALSEIADAKGVTVSAVALAWMLHKPAVTAPIIGANSPTQLADLLPARSWVAATSRSPPTKWSAPGRREQAVHVTRTRRRVPMSKLIVWMNPSLDWLYLPRRRRTAVRKVDSSTQDTPHSPEYMTNQADCWFRQVGKREES